MKKKRRRKKNKNYKKKKEKKTRKTESIICEHKIQRFHMPVTKKTVFSLMLSMVEITIHLKR